MFALRPDWRRTLSLATMAVVLVVPLAGCQKKTLSTEVEKKPDKIPAFGPCLPWYATNVQSVAMSADGKRMLYISQDAPGNLSKAQSESWASDDRALMVREVDDSGTASRRFIALSWDTLADGTIRAFATPGGSDTELEPTMLKETMSSVSLSADGQRFVIGVKRAAVIGNYAKLYTGVVPDASQLTDPKTGETKPLTPGDGLELIPINNFGATEGIQSYTLSADGRKVAAVVGVQGAVRVYDIQAKKLTAFIADKTGKISLSDKLPPVQINLNTINNEAVVSQGGMHLAWDPKAQQLAITRGDGVSGQAIWLLDTQSGKLVTVRRFQDSTMPHVVWSKDGASLFVMNTPISSGNVFGNSEIRHIQAKEKGADIGKGGGLNRVVGMRSEPIELTGFGDDEHFLFIWDDVLYRLDMPGGDPAKAQFVALSNTRDNVLRVLPGPLHTSADRQLVAFLAQDKTTEDISIGVREEAFKDACSTQVMATSEAADKPTATPEKKK